MFYSSVKNPRFTTLLTIAPLMLLVATWMAFDTHTAYASLAAQIRTHGNSFSTFGPSGSTLTDNQTSAATVYYKDGIEDIHYAFTGTNSGGPVGKVNVVSGLTAANDLSHMIVSSLDGRFIKRLLDRLVSGGKFAPEDTAFNAALQLDLPALIYISEIRIDQPNANNDEYFELAGPPAASLDGLTYLVIGDGSGLYGVIENVVDLTGNTIPGSGYFVVAKSSFSLGRADLIAPLRFENKDNVTHLVVRDFSGFNGEDLDINDDGILDVTPWAEVIDSVALIHRVGSGDKVYSSVRVGPDGSTVPGHVLFCPSGWEMGSFDPAISNDTPGAANACSLSIAPLVINEIDCDQPGTDTAEFIEIKNVLSTPISLAPFNIVLVQSIDGSVSYNTIDLPDVTLLPDEYFVICSNAGIVANCDLDVSPDIDLIQNGTLGTVVLTNGGMVIDAVGCEEETEELSGNEFIVRTLDSSAVVNGDKGISRCPDGPDIDQNDTNFIYADITPGSLNVCALSSQPPIAYAGGPYIVNEGGSVQLDATGTSDPDQSADVLSYEWDFNNDGVFDEASGSSPIFHATGLDGPGSVMISLQVTDDEGLTDTDSVTVEIINVPPSPDAGPDQTIFRYDPVTVAGIWHDPAGSLDDPYTWSWDLDDDGVPDVSGTALFGDTITEAASFEFAGLYTLEFTVTDKDGDSGSDFLVVEVLNQPPDCSNAVPSVDTLWPANHKLVTIDILGVTDPDGDPLTITVDSIYQDEPVDTTGDGSFTPDGRGIGTPTFEVRAERAGSGNGRVYHISFTADDGSDMCNGEVLVSVPHSQGKNGAPLDEGALYDSTAITP